MTIRIGASGWRYPPWRGVFYPKGLPQRRELEFAARYFGSVEINGSFYSLQTPASYADWHDATPADFVFSVKGPRGPPRVVIAIGIGKHYLTTVWPDKTRAASRLKAVRDVPGRELPGDDR